MILVDFSALVYQTMYSAVSAVKPSTQEDGKYCTSEFMPYMLYRTFEVLFEVQEQFSTYGDMILCLDGESKSNWRKRLYPMYKSSRPIARSASNINFSEVFDAINSLVDILKTSTPWKVVKVPKAEGDDVIMVLAKLFNSNPVMIVSNDKDMIQMQKFGNIRQYSLLTQKFVTPATKNDTMDEWLLEHVILGDTIDDVPRVVDGLQFTDTFKNFLTQRGLNLSELEVRNSNWYDLGFSEYKLDRNGNPKCLDIFKSERFGISTCKKLIQKFGTLDAWLDSDPRLRSNYELNRKLVLEEGIPDDVRTEIVEALKTSSASVDMPKLKEYFANNRISHLSLIMPPSFTKNLNLFDMF